MNQKLLCTCRIIVGVLFVATVSPVSASERRSFVIPPADGYGIGECLKQGGACGHAVADSWCEAHGLTSAVTFGPADDVTSAIAADSSKEPIEPGSFVVNCAD